MIQNQIIHIHGLPPLPFPLGLLVGSSVADTDGLGVGKNGSLTVDEVDDEVEDVIGCGLGGDNTGGKLELVCVPEPISFSVNLCKLL